MGQDSYLPLEKSGQSVIDQNLPYRFLRGQPLKHEDFSRQRRRQLTVETGTRSIAHDIPLTNDVALPPTT